MPTASTDAERQFAGAIRESIQAMSDGRSPSRRRPVRRIFILGMWFVISVLLIAGVAAGINQ